MAYIKLGPIGNYFGSSRLGIYLSEGNAAQVDDNLLNSTLAKFLLTGFFVTIDKHEFENIKIDRRALRGIPLQFVGVNPVTIIEPVYDYLDQPPVETSGDRFIVGPNPTGLWSGLAGMIVQWSGDDESWKVITPKDGWIIPIINLGVSTTYKGTYPSGKWDLTQKRIRQLRESFNQTNPSPTEENPNATRAWTLEQIGIETQQRIEADNELKALIQEITTDPSNATPASRVTILDEGDYFQATNVEMALQELAADLKDTDNQLSVLTTLYQQLSNQVDQLTGGNPGGAFTTKAYVYLNISQIFLGHVLGRIPLWQLYQIETPNGTTINSNSVLNGVIAQPYRVTYNDIRFEFPRSINLVLILA